MTARASRLTDRRRHARTALSFKVTYSTGDRTATTFGANLSLGGMQLRSAGELAAGFTIPFSLHLDDGGEPLLVSGRVVALVGERNPAAGIEFAAGQDEALARLHKFLGEVVVPKLERATAGPSPSAAKVIELGALYYDFGRNDDALALYRRGLASNRRHLELHEQAAVFLLAVAGSAAPAAAPALVAELHTVAEAGRHIAASEVLEGALAECERLQNTAQAAESAVQRQKEEARIAALADERARKQVEADADRLRRDLQSEVEQSLATQGREIETQRHKLDEDRAALASERTDLEKARRALGEVEKRLRAEEAAHRQTLAVHEQTVATHQRTVADWQRAQTEAAATHDKAKNELGQELQRLEQAQRELDGERKESETTRELLAAEQLAATARAKEAEAVLARQAALDERDREAARRLTEINLFQLELERQHEQVGLRRAALETQAAGLRDVEADLANQRAELTRMRGAISEEGVALGQTRADVQAEQAQLKESATALATERATLEQERSWIAEERAHLESGRTADQKVLDKLQAELREQRKALDRARAEELAQAARLKTELEERTRAREQELATAAQGLEEREKALTDKLRAERQLEHLPASAPVPVAELATVLPSERKRLMVAAAAGLAVGGLLAALFFGLRATTPVAAEDHAVPAHAARANPVKPEAGETTSTAKPAAASESADDDAPPLPSPERRRRAAEKGKGGPGKPTADQLFDEAFK